MYVFKVFIGPKLVTSLLAEKETSAIEKAKSKFPQLDTLQNKSLWRSRKIGEKIIQNIEAVVF